MRTQCTSRHMNSTHLTIQTNSNTYTYNVCMWCEHSWALNAFLLILFCLYSLKPNLQTKIVFELILFLFSSLFAQSLSPSLRPLSYCRFYLNGDTLEFIFSQSFFLSSTFTLYCQQQNCKMYNIALKTDAAIHVWWLCGEYGLFN